MKSISPRQGFSFLPLLSLAALFVSLVVILPVSSAQIKTNLPSSDGHFRFSLLPKKQLAPDFSLPNLQDETVKLSDFKGKVVLLNFWATWCLPCREEMPSMQKLYEQLKGEGFDIVAVSVDRGDVDKVRAFVKDYQLTFSTLHDREAKVAFDYKVRGIPVSYLIDKEGNMVGGLIGGGDWSSKEAVKLVKTLLNGAQ